jgi:GGDEF domain-containing protein
MSLSRGLRQQLTRNKFLAEHDLLTDLPNRVLFHRYAMGSNLVDRAEL